MFAFPGRGEEVEEGLQNRTMGEVSREANEGLLSWGSVDAWRKSEIGMITKTS